MYSEHVPMNHNGYLYNVSPEFNGLAAGTAVIYDPAIYDPVPNYQYPPRGFTFPKQVDSLSELQQTAPLQPAPQPAPQPKKKSMARMDLKVDKLEKDHAKFLGARWDGKTWYTMYDEDSMKNEKGTHLTQFHVSLFITLSLPRTVF